MTKNIFLIITFFLFVLVFTSTVYSQLQTDSNTVKTRVGNPTTPGSGEVPPPPEDIRQGIINNFGVTMNGFDIDHLRWTWERLWEVSNTKFIEMVRGAIVQASSGGLSYQAGCFGGETSLYLGQYQPREFFKFIVLHEFGHIVTACNTRARTLQVEQQNAFYQEGGVSYYANNATACAGSNGLNEDYADMLAYYLDRAAGLSSGPKGCGVANPPNPYGSGGFPIHAGVAERVLQ